MCSTLHEPPPGQLRGATPQPGAQQARCCKMCPLPEPQLIPPEPSHAWEPKTAPRPRVTLYPPLNTDRFQSTPAEGLQCFAVPVQHPAPLPVLQGKQPMPASGTLATIAPLHTMPTCLGLELTRPITRSLGHKAHHPTRCLAPSQPLLSIAGPCARTEPDSQKAHETSPRQLKRGPVGRGNARPDALTSITRCASKRGQLP